MNQFPPTSLGNKSSNGVDQLSSYLPVDAVIHDGRPAIKWIDIGDADFKEPFFHETIARLESSPTVITELDSLLQLEKITDTVEPDGFIFHSSRCGSTLLANACKVLEDSIVISEAPVLDKLATRFFTDAPDHSPKELLYMLFLRAAVNLLGRPRKGSERRYFVKFACTTTLQLERIRRVWPAVPIVFLYRDPLEIIVSNLKATPEWMQPGPNPATAAAIVGVDQVELYKISAEEFCARAVGRFFGAAVSINSPQIRVLNYSRARTEWLVDALNHFGVVPNTSEADAIEQVSRLYSKDLAGRQAFISDSAAKRASATEEIIEMADRWARASYERLNMIGEGKTA
jgi:hypothetical protein